MTSPIYLSAREAAAELGVQPATLYAYVSRGLIRSVPGPGKQRRYAAEDVRRLQDRKGPGEAVDARPLSGDAVLETQLTLISEQGPFYRGVAATDLARSSSLEAVATLLWKSTEDPFSQGLEVSLPVLPEAAGPLERLMATLAIWPTLDPVAYTLSPRLLHRKGATLTRLAAAALLNRPPSGDLLHLQLARAWGVGEAQADLLRAILVLSADHELNTSAFAVRCAASTRAPLHAALLSGLGAFAGPRHGSAVDRVMAWLEGVESPAGLSEVLNARLRRGEPLPGYGHAVYETRDPRAECLLSLLAQTPGLNDFAALVPDLVGQADALFGVFPNIDFALAVTQKALGLPADAGKVLFCAGRMTGWIAHALEQYESGEQIRPRAAYTGERPKGIGL